MKSGGLRRRSPDVLLGVALLFALPLNAGTLRFFGSAGFETPGHADAVAFFEAAPESKRWKTRLKLGTESDLGEAFVQVQLTPHIDVTAGRIIEKWGTGYGWTPTAFVGPARNPTDPTDRHFADRGVDMIRVDAFVHDTGASFYALRDGRFAARVYRLVRGTDVSLVARSDNKFGVNASRVFGERLELHGELTNDAVLAGAQVTFANTNVVAELFHGDDDWAFVRVQHSFIEVIAARNLHDGKSFIRTTLSHRIESRIELYALGTEYLHWKRELSAGVRVSF